MSEKIEAIHLQRKAVLYIRQSSPFQVLHNEESRRLQYAMQQRMRSLGWKDIEVIDEDLGRSASGSVVRSGFERMVADVCLGKIGAVAAREVSRFARNSREWQQLVEVCRVVDTLLIDQETVYAPRRSNDRLLLGLKGSLNEYELDLLRQRSVEARREKARRGELIISAPVGYLKTGTTRGKDQRIEKDPNTRVQQMINLVFRKCFELGSARQALMWLLEEDLQMPTRDKAGVLKWKRPTYGMVYQILTHPVYGGAYAYGRTEHQPSYEGGFVDSKTRRRSREEWIALIPEHHEGYVSWEEFERLQDLISSNNLRSGRGAARKGSALLSGMLGCQQCGRRLAVAYSGVGAKVPRYCCHRGYLDNGEAKCIAFGATSVDIAVAEQIFRVVAPAAQEAAMLAHQKTTERDNEILQALEGELKSARYEASRAQRQFDAADPENRLVTEELERRWNASMQHVSDVEARIDQQRNDRSSIDDPDLQGLMAVVADLDAVWNNPDADIRIKKRIVRTLIRDIVADVDNDVSEVILTIHWVGGVHTELRLPRRRRGKSTATTATSAEAVDAVRSLARICSDDLIAGLLNRNGLPTGRGNRWTRERVTSMRNYHKIARWTAQAQSDQGWMNLTDSAKHLGISTRTLRLAIERADIKGQHPLPDGPWIINRSELETPAAKAVVRKAKTRNRNPAVPDPKQQSLEF
ncbi:recombinase family protein [Fuerstiella marisgermanici]|uniref:Recombinase n=1 Tax=Fuerstiella marisgermanici TaxID=1891926 RepID=A0A1P8WBT7_9PLAN|nr:recombinase family protein [Fuerstiella marisgermanici]APZ91521.1 Recombinase [Fuerstiella marisgermanici]APZ96839.1 Recombinase [Fuerstiella marisgermanici]